MVPRIYLYMDWNNSNIKQDIQATVMCVRCVCNRLTNQDSDKTGPYKDHQQKSLDMEIFCAKSVIRRGISRRLHTRSTQCGGHPGHNMHSPLKKERG